MVAIATVFTECKSALNFSFNEKITEIIVQEMKHFIGENMSFLRSYLAYSYLNSCTFLPEIKITSYAKTINLIFFFMMEMGCFSVYTQKIHSTDLRSFIHCFIYKLHLMSSWVHLNRDKLIEWEFFHPAYTT